MYPVKGGGNGGETMVDVEVNVRRTRVRSHQTDLNGAMYHGAYLDVFDDARIDTFRDLGYTYERVVDEGWNLVIRRIECEYFKPAFMDEIVAVVVLVSHLRAATMAIQYHCLRGEELLATGHVTYAFIDRSGRVMRVPADLRTLIHETPALSLPARGTASGAQKDASDEAPSKMRHMEPMAGLEPAT